MTRRRRREPDHRLDWRDPDMPVLVATEAPWGGKYLAETPADENHEFFASKMTDPSYQHRYPGWRDDPTYALRRRPRRKL